MIVSSALRNMPRASNRQLRLQTQSYDFRGFLLWLGTIFSITARMNPNATSIQVVAAARCKWGEFQQSRIDYWQQMARHSQLEVKSEEDKESHVLARAALIEYAIARGFETRVRTLREQLEMCTGIVVTPDVD
jgi:hypothetical protein